MAGRSSSRLPGRLADPERQIAVCWDGAAPGVAVCDQAGLVVSFIWSRGLPFGFGQVSVLRGQCPCLSVQIGGWKARGHGHIADSVTADASTYRHLCSSEAVWRCRQESTVKPSAQPTLVRTQHLPPPAKTARSLRKRGPAGRFPLVPPCVIVCRCRSSRSDRYGHIADSVRAEGAVRGTACFADPRPFCPVTRAPDSSPDWRIPHIPGGRFSAVLLAPRGGLALFVPAAGAGCRIGPRHLIEAPWRG